MASECYYGKCPHHSCNQGPDEGPFCHEPKCLAAPEQIAQWQIEREEQLARCLPLRQQIDAAITAAPSKWRK